LPRLAPASPAPDFAERRLALAQQILYRRVYKGRNPIRGNPPLSAHTIQTSAARDDQAQRTADRMGTTASAVYRAESRSVSAIPRAAKPASASSPLFEAVFGSFAGRGAASATFVSGGAGAGAATGGGGTGASLASGETVTICSPGSGLTDGAE